MCHISTGKASGAMETAWRRKARDGGGPTAVGGCDSGLGADMERLVPTAARVGAILWVRRLFPHSFWRQCGEAHWCTGEASAVAQPREARASHRQDVTWHVDAASWLGRPSSVWKWKELGHNGACSLTTAKSCRSHPGRDPEGNRQGLGRTVLLGRVES
jgi:hypothetical protein